MKAHVRRKRCQKCKGLTPPRLTYQTKHGPICRDFYEDGVRRESRLEGKPNKIGDENE